MYIQNIKKYCIYFVLYSVIGWIYEVFLEVMVYRWGFSNRGFLLGPYCPVYGFGAIAFIIMFQGVKSKKIKAVNINISPALIFFGIMITATAIELAASYMLDAVGASRLWDYSSYSFNFQGRIALNPSVRFGIGGMIFLYILQPLFEKTINRLNTSRLNILFFTLACIMGIDFILRIFSF